MRAKEITGKKIIIEKETVSTDDFDQLVLTIDALEIPDIIEIKRTSKSGSGIKIFTQSVAQRMATMNALLEQLPEVDGEKAKHEQSASSSIGCIVYDGWKIEIKPLNRQGDKSAGVSAEKFFVDKIKEYLNESTPLDIVIKAGSKKFEMKKVTEVESTGSKTAGRSKSDVDFKSEDGKEYKLSLKKANAEIWESADSYYGKTGTHIVGKLLEQKLIAVYDMDTNATINDLQELSPKRTYKLFPEIAIQSNEDEKLDVVFGSDIKWEDHTGCVVVQTFMNNHFKLVNGILEITAQELVLSPSDLSGDMEPWFIIRNDSARQVKGMVKGLRPLCVTKSRVSGETKQVLKVQTSGDTSSSKFEVKVTAEDKNKFLEVVKKCRSLTVEKMEKSMRTNIRRLSGHKMIDLIKKFKSKFPYEFDDKNKNFYRTDGNGNKRFTQNQVILYFFDVIYSNLDNDELQNLIEMVLNITVEWDDDINAWLEIDHIINYYALHPKVESKQEKQRKEFKSLWKYAKNID
jgi:hypothetical protein